MRDSEGITIYRTVWFDGPNGEERDIPVCILNDAGITPVHNPRGNAYAHRNDRRYRPNKLHYCPIQRAGTRSWSSTA